MGRKGLAAVEWLERCYGYTGDTWLWPEGVEVHRKFEVGEWRAEKRKEGV